MSTIQSRIVAASLCLLLGFTVIAAETSEGFYDQDQVRGFVSLKGDYRKMDAQGMENLNAMLFNLDWGDGSDLSGRAVDLNGYKQFKRTYVGMHVDIGAEYQQFLTWFDIDFMPTQVSKRPSRTGNSGAPLYDIEWNAYGANWMFGWKLLPAESPINVIPSVGAGFDLMNVHLGSLYMILNAEDKTDTTITRNRTYSSMGPTFNAELEARLQLGQLSVGAYGGYKVARYDALTIEGFTVGSADLVGDTWFVGGKVTWTMLSAWQRKQREKI